jgi:integrase
VLSNTGIRIGEARTLTWQNIRIEPVADSDDLTVIFNVSGKTGAREVVASRYEVMEYLQRIKALYDNPSPDDLVFAHPDGSAILSFKKSFASLTQYVGVEFNSDGDRHTIYSLRHTYATFRLGENVSVYALSKNMGTSIRMIERFYGQNRTPDQAAELTKMRNLNRTAKPVLQMLDNL